MKYKNIGKYFEYEVLEKYEINQCQLSKAINVAPNRIHEIIKGRRRITPNTDIRLCKFFKFPNGHFLKIQMEMELFEEFEQISNELDKIITYENLRK